MAIKIGHASIDERGKPSGGAAGDQTGKVDWALTGTTGLTENTTYHWIAVGKE